MKEKNKTNPSGYKKMIIEPGSQSLLFTAGEMWRYRELFYFLLWRDISVKYKQTILGAAWVILQPLLSMIIFTLVFNRMVGIEVDDAPYPIFVLVGIIVWNFFAGSLNRSGESLVTYNNLMTKVYFPRMLIPCAAGSALMVDFLISLLVLAVMMIYYGIVPGVQLLAIPPLMALMMLFTLSVGVFTSAANVRFRDVKFVLEFATRIWFFFTPVVYSFSKIPEQYQPLAMLNPMYGIVEGFRWAVYGRDFPAMELLASGALTLFVFVVAQSYFRRVERTFADVV